ncbi:ABC transporter permease [Phyllobacterium sp. SYP-B3895]|uniref:ABC transporter permease n=1 Tax=Phyllobacterium sp. SYP-B3895 TaxID=2663240 RepID=UPI001299CD07|nr:ABC transporter permease [Phyllobacterium sp. SYP-B3895]MRG54617.1 ABC transporter permease [Phyllobacterium sp. SYP-B3895]
MPSVRRFGIIDVAVREVIWIWRDKVALLLVAGIPVIAFAILAATFSNAVIRDLQVDVVDQDRSKTSETFVQAINSAPGVSVARRSSDLNGAMHAVRSGDAIAAVYIPDNFERNITKGSRPQAVIFFNKQFFTPGNVASSALQAAISAAVADLQPGSQSTAYAPGALVVEQYVLTNPALNYAQFLLRAILPTVLHVMMAISGGFAVGSEFGSRNMREWLSTAGDSMLIALVGKLAPYFGIFLVMMAAGLMIIHGGFEIPFRGDPALAGSAACFLIVAYLSLGALLQLLVKNLAFGLSLTGVICSPAFGFAGVGFPVLAMNAFALAWGTILPLRWYIQILFDQAARGAPVADSVQPFMMLGGLAVVYFGLAWLRLRSVARHPLPRPVEAPERHTSCRFGIVRAFTEEYGRVIRDRSAFGLIVVAPIIYGVFYPQPYLSQLIKDIPIAVVDNDSSAVSHTIIQAVDADEAVKVALRPTTLAEAQAALSRREVFGILSIPAGTEREILKGDQARLPAYVDSAYFLLYNRTLQGIQEGVGAVTTDIAGRGARPDGSLFRAALVKSSPVEILNQPLFNPTGGYASYVVPAAFLLILQQTLLMGSATLGGVAYEHGGRSGRRRRGTVSAMIGQTLAHLLLALPGYALFLVVLPRVYGFSANDRVLDLIVLAIPFILSVSLLGQFVGSWFKRRETAVMLFIAISLPIFFLVGVAWPLEAIPPILRTISFVLPSTSGIDGLVRVNQMGATLADVSRDWMRLWVLTVVYAILAVVAARMASRKRMSDAR